MKLTIEQVRSKVDDMLTRLGATPQMWAVTREGFISQVMAYVDAVGGETRTIWAVHFTRGTVIDRPADPVETDWARAVVQDAKEAVRKAFDEND